MITKLLSLIFLVATLVAAQSAPPRRDIPAIAKAANGVVVSIIMSDKDGRPVAQGTGFFVSNDGRIVTNYHVIKHGSSAVVKLPDGAFYDVEGMLAFDEARDVAIIKARGQNFRTVTLGDSDRIQVGETVVAIGNPLSLESTVSSGIVSGIRNITEEGGKFVQITAPISPGSSGGPVFNMAGEVIGITTLYLKGGENLNFAIPINDAKHLLSTESKVHHFPNETEAVEDQEPDNPKLSSTKFLSRKLVCLDGVLRTVETPFKNLGDGCILFVVPLPLAPEDARLLQGDSPEDDKLLEDLETAWGNAIQIQTVISNQQSAARSIESGTPQLIGAIWATFQKNREAFCSRHPTMYVLDMKLDGTTTPPVRCSRLPGDVSYTPPRSKPDK